MNQSIGLKMATVMKVLNDPLAPNKLQDAYKAVQACGKMFAASGTCTKEQAQAMLDRLTKDFPDAELDANGVASSPEFITALCNMLANSILVYTSKL